MTDCPKNPQGVHVWKIAYRTEAYTGYKIFFWYCIFCRKTENLDA